MKKIIFIAILALACGCVKAKPITGPDGTLVYNISCGGIQNSMADCLEKAGEICGARGYQVLDAEKEYTTTNTLYYTANPSQPYVNMPINKQKRNMIIQCK